MKKFIPTVLMFLVVFSGTVFAQNAAQTADGLTEVQEETVQGEGSVYKVTYTYKGKRAVYDKDYRDVYDDFKLEISGSRGVFYSEYEYVEDSLTRVAFDKWGNAVDNKLYYGMFTHRKYGSKMVCFMNYRSGKCRVSYTTPEMIINGKGNLEMPQWEITDSTRVSEEGYTVTKAVARYLGRQWIVWYTEEIPMPYGPWFLWGTPGLVIMAYDSSENFIFRFSGLELARESRYNSVWRQRFKKYFKSHTIYNYPLGSAEKMYTRIKTDADYLFQLTGSRELGYRGPDGAFHPVIKEYEPLIPNSYWKDRKAQEKVIRKQRKEMQVDYEFLDSVHRNYQKVLEQIK